MKRITLCADDYGQNTAISQAIIDLSLKKRLSATSCMTNSAHWLLHAKELKNIEKLVDIGLHFNLTEGVPFTAELGSRFGSVSNLIIKAYSGLLNRTAIKAELHAQIDQFIAGMGRAPDFIDGHQHILQLPIVREVFLSVYEERLRASNCYVRSVYAPAMMKQFMASGYYKTAVVQLCGAKTFKKRLEARTIPHNTSFAGFYNFADASRYEEHFPLFIRQVADKGIIMCHPGLVGDEKEDAITHSRFLEYQYLLSDRFFVDCAKKKIIIGRFYEEQNDNSPISIQR